MMIGMTGMMNQHPMLSPPTLIKGRAKGARERISEDAEPRQIIEDATVLRARQIIEPTLLLLHGGGCGDPRTRAALRRPKAVAEITRAKEVPRSAI